jgi:hypothetical protein
MSACQGLWECGGKELLLAAIGSLAGALGAWWIADRAKRKDDALKVMRSINIATSLGKAILEEYMAVKKQRILELKSKYDQDRAKCLRLQAMHDAGVLPQGTYSIETHLGTIDVPLIPIAALEREVYERQAVSGKVLACMNAIISWSNSFNRVVAQRQEVIDGFKGKADPRAYFGLPTESGVDERYKDTMQGISEYCDNVIYFAYRFTKESEKYGHRYLKKNKGLLRSSGVIVNTTNFDDAYRQGLMPSEGRFQAWERGMIEVETKPRGWAWFVDCYNKAREECRFPEGR